MIRAQNLAPLAGIRHGFLTRQGGVSGGLFDSLNCGYGSGDDPEKVTENRRLALALLGAEGARLVTAAQVHSNRAVLVEEAWDRAGAPQADALVTRTSGIALGILTADCVPVLLADPQARVVGAAHAGWRGARDGILDAVIGIMCAQGAEPDRITAAVGPAIAQDSYEVGDDMMADFVGRDAGCASFFRDSTRRGHKMFDLKAFVAARLAALGLAAVEIRPEDTYRDSARFYSYRRACHRGEKDFGRGLSVILLADEPDPDRSPAQQGDPAI